MKKLFCLLLCMCTVLSQIDIFPVFALEQTMINIEDSEVTDTGELFKIQYSGDWTGGSNHPELFSNGDEHYSDTIGDYFTLKFYGTKVEIYGSINKNHGTYSVNVDGIDYPDINAKTSGATTHKQLLSTINDLDDKEHILKVVNKGPRSIQIDNIKVWYGDIKASDVTLKKDNAKIEVGGTSKIISTLYPEVATSGTITYSSSDNNIATVSEEGVITGVGLGTTTINVLLDGEKKKEVTVQVVEEIEALTVTLADHYKLEQQDDYETIINNTQYSFNDIAWKNDVVTSKIAVTTLEEAVDNVTLSISDFKDGDKVLSKDNMKVNWIREVEAYIGKGTTSSPKESFPDVISHDVTRTLDANTVNFVWVEINVPKDIEAGTYKGTVTIQSSSSKKVEEIEYTIEVIDLTVPEEPMTDMQIWQHPFSQAGYLGLSEDQYFSQEHFDYMRSSMIEYAKMGSRDLVCNIVDEAWGHQSYFGDATMVQWTKKSDGTFEFDYTMLDRWVNFGIECGVVNPVKGIGKLKCYSIVPWNNRVTYYDEATQKEVQKNLTVGSDEWKDIWEQFLESFVDYVEEKGWFDITYIAMDERPVSALTPTVELIESITNQDGEHLKVFCACNYFEANLYSLTDRIDDISIGLKHINHTTEEYRNFVKHRRDLGLDTTIYTCTGDYPGNFLISDPADNYWLMWYTMTQQADGYLKWAWDNWVKDPLNSPNYKSWEPGDGWYIYPVEKENIGEVNYYSTPRYEMMKEGIRDIAKAKYLMSLDKDLDTIISNLVLGMDRAERGNNGYGSATYANESERMITINESKRMKATIDDIAYQYVMNDGEVIFKDNLAKLIEEAETINSLYYTQASIKALNNALIKAKEVYHSQDITKDMLLEAEEQLQTALDNLVDFDPTTTWPSIDENTLINTEEDKDKVKGIDCSSECDESMESNRLGTLEASLDYNTNTIWHSNYETHLGKEHWIVYDLQENYTITDIRLLPRQTGVIGNGDILSMKVYVSDTQEFDEDTFVGGYEFKNDGQKLLNTDFQRVYLGEEVKGRYVKILVTHCGGGKIDQYAALSEIRFYGTQKVDIDKTNLSAKIEEVKNV